MEHLSGGQMARFGHRELTPAELFDADAHLAVCAECRAAMAFIVEASLGFGSALIDAVDAARGEHLSYEQMDAWVENQLDPAERELVMAHIALCAECARQLRAYES